MRRRNLVLAMVVSLVASAAPKLATAGLGDLKGKLGKVKGARDKASEVNAKIDGEQEHYLGRAVAAKLIGRYGLVTDDTLTRYVATLGTYLASLSTNPEATYRFALLDSDEVNAFAAPAGFIFITRGALASAQDEAELASIVAHEVVHAAERHAIKSIEDSYRKKVIMGGLAEAAAKATGADPKLVQIFGEIADEATENLLTKGYDRKLEFEADRGAVILLALAGYDPQALVTCVGRLEEAKASGAMATLSRTHPSPAQRAEAAEKVIDKEKIPPRPEARFAELFAQAVKK